jgi:hypothetical protein
MALRRATGTRLNHAAFQWCGAIQQIDEQRNTLLGRRLLATHIAKEKQESFNLAPPDRHRTCFNGDYYRRDAAMANSYSK